jgi:uracil-DNA glycosylase
VELVRTISALIAAVREEADRADFPLDRPVYQTAGREPTSPILFAGSLEAPVCVFGRDLGKDEVAVGQPLVGAAGRLVRAGVYRALHGEPPAAADRRLDSVLDRVLLTNTVPYKPPGNKAYPATVKERFRPFMAELLTVHWQGDQVITLGTEAFQWFAPYADPELFAAFWSREDRYEASFSCDLIVTPGLRSPASKTVTLLPLPHPSPLNQRWYKKFPDLLARRLDELGLSRAS